MKQGCRSRLGKTNARACVLVPCVKTGKFSYVAIADGPFITPDCIGKMLLAAESFPFGSLPNKPSGDRGAGAAELSHVVNGLNVSYQGSQRDALRDQSLYGRHVRQVSSVAESGDAA